MLLKELERTPDRCIPAPEHLLRPTPPMERAAQAAGLTTQEEAAWSHHIHELYVESLRAHRATVDEHMKLRRCLQERHGPHGDDGTVIVPPTAAARECQSWQAT